MYICVYTYIHGHIKFYYINTYRLNLDYFIGFHFILLLRNGNISPFWESIINIMTGQTFLEIIYSR